MYLSASEEPIELVKELKQKLDQSVCHFSNLGKYYKICEWNTFLHVDLQNYIGTLDELRNLSKHTDRPKVREMIAMSNQFLNDANFTTAEKLHVRRRNELTRTTLDLHGRIDERIEILSNALFTIRSIGHIRDHRRNRRSFFSMLGIGMSILNFAESQSLRHSVKKVAKRQDEIAQSLISTVQVVDATNTRVSLNTDSIKRLSAMQRQVNTRLNDVIGTVYENYNDRRLFRAIAQYEQYILYMMTTIDSLTEFCTILDNQLTHSLKDSTLSVSFLPADKFNDILTNISNRLTDSLRLPFDRKDLHLYYSHAHVTFLPTSDESEVSFILKIPILDTAQYLNVYRVTPLPVKNNKLDMYAYIDFETNLIGMSSDELYYTPIDDETYEQMTKMRSIPENMVMKSRQKDKTCVSETFYGSNDIENCKSYLNNVKSQVTHLHHDIFYVFTPETLKINYECPKYESHRLVMEQSVLIIREPWLIRISTGCTVWTQYWKIFTKHASRIIDELTLEIPGTFNKYAQVTPWSSLKTPELHWLMNMSDSELSRIKRNIKLSTELDPKMEIKHIQTKLEKIRKESVHVSEWHWTKILWISLASLGAIGIICIIVYIIIWRYRLRRLNNNDSKDEKMDYVSEKVDNNPTAPPPSPGIPIYPRDVMADWPPVSKNKNNKRPNRQPDPQFPLARVHKNGDIELSLNLTKKQRDRLEKGLYPDLKTVHEETAA